MHPTEIARLIIAAGDAIARLVEIRETMKSHVTPEVLEQVALERRDATRRFFEIAEGPADLEADVDPRA